jgi:hypothetical protein
MGVWYIAGFCSGLRGEEMVLIERAGTVNSLVHLAEKDPWFKLVISGPTKGNQLSGSKFAIPIVGTTQGANLEPGKWMTRLAAILKAEGLKNGRLFTRRLSPPRLFEFEEDFYKVLEKIQATTDLICSDEVVSEMFGILRSLRRGVTTHARVMGVAETLLHIFNRWRLEMNAKGIANLDMADTYSKLETLAPLLLDFSRPL